MFFLKGDKCKTRIYANRAYNYHVELRSQLYERSSSIVSFIKELENIKKWRLISI